MTTAKIRPLILGGGATAKRCDICGAEPGHRCCTSGGADASKPHAGRGAAEAGDLVLVRTNGLALAMLVDIGEHVTVRLWRGAAQTFATPRLLPRTAVVRLADETAAATVLARAELARGLEQAKEAQHAAFTAALPDRDAAILAGRQALRDALGHSPTDRR